MGKQERQSSNSNENVQGSDNSGVIRIDDQSHIRKSTREAVVASNPAIQKKIKQDHRASIVAGEQHAQRLMEVAMNNPSPTVSQPVNQPLTPQVEVPSSYSNSVLSDLSQLINVGRIEKEVMVQGYKFVIHTLSNTENDKVFESVATINDELKRLGMLRLSILAVAIKTVNDVPIESLYQGSEQLSIHQKREYVIGAWQQMFTQAIFDEYDKIVDESSKMLGQGEELKN